MIGQPLVHKRVVGLIHVHEAEILAHEIVEEQLRLVTHRVGQLLVEVREPKRVGMHLVEILEPQPLPGEP